MTPPLSSFRQLEAACCARRPALVVVLGSGLGDLANTFSSPLRVPFASIPGLPASSVEGHRGCLTLVEWEARPVLISEGRLHRYEGHPWSVVEKILAVARELGASEAFLTNASGGIREDLAPGTLMQIQNHLDATEPRWWLKQGGAVRGGWLSAPYDGELLERVADAARRVAVPLCRGTYAAVTGPSYETPAEVRALRSCGVDAVGMSTAHEVDVASRRGMKCTAVSCITNRAAGLPGANLDHQEVIAMAGSVAEKVRMVLEAFIGLR